MTERREALRIGGLGMGLTLADLLAGRATASAVGDDGARSFGRAKSCILLFLMGGPPQHSTWDPKPDAPAEVRGDFGAIATKVPGLSLGSLFPNVAKVADKVAFLRAVSTGDNAHSSSGYYMLTGRPHAPMNFENANPGAPNDSPSLGAVLGRVAEREGLGARPLPPTVTLPHRIFNTDGSVWPGQDAGFLGRSRDPWLLNGKLTPQGYQIQEIDLPASLDVERLTGRRDLLDRVQRGLDGLGQRAFDHRTRQAHDLLGSPAARTAFRLDLEPEPIRERYGETPFGQSVLLGRRLVEAGVRLVQVNWYRGADEPPQNPCWDSHIKESERLKNVLAPPTDQAFSALVEDLDGRGRLDETLVVCMSEFGRSPRLDGAGGRGHWGSVFSVALAGGGIRGGRAHGSSDKIGAYPKDGRVRPEDLMATVFHCLGYRPETEYQDALGRPHPLTRGEAITAIL